MNHELGRILVPIAALVSVFVLSSCRKAEVLELSELETAAVGEAAETQVLTEEENPAAEEAAETQAKVYVVHICGAVNSPGVYELAAGSRIRDAVRAAGGLAEDASEGFVNLASPLEDGMQVLIPTREEAEAAANGAVVRIDGAILNPDGHPSVESASEEALSEQTGQDLVGSDDGLVNLNTATVTELMTLPGIGETRAKAIIAYREASGGFSSIEEIMQVNGIKEGSFEKLRDYIAVR